MICPACGGAAGDGARFCPTCGQQLVSRSDERRVATVVFADLVGFTALSETRDPEHIKELVDGCFERLVHDITSFGGRVDKIIGDAILSLFGAPIAHEDDAERAVRAALRMQQTIVEYADEIGASIQMRIGVNTGEVLVGALRAGGEYTAMGDVVNTAQRLQTVADPGAVVVGPATHVATADAIEYRALGLVDARGREEPVDAWTAIEPLLPPGYRRRKLQTPFVGRAAEMGVLGQAIDATVIRQRAHLLLLLGEAGVGKSRLAEEVGQLAECNHGAVVFEGRCVPYGEANVWWPVAEALRHACDIPADAPLADADRQCSAAVSQVLGQADRSPEVKRIVNGLLYLMGYEVSLHDIDPVRARAEASRSVLAFVEASAKVQPVVVVISDLHWADDLVLEMLDALLDRVSRSPAVLIATARRSLLDRRPLPTGRHDTIIVNLDPLDRAAASELLTSLFEHETDETTREALLDRSGGNPFFLEELVAYVAAEEGDRATRSTANVTGVHSGPLTELPDTLRGLLAARIDALSAAERVTLEDAAVWGRSGPVEALDIMAQEMHGIDDAQPALRRLVADEIMVVNGKRWRVRNDLVREVAYGMLTKADRARRHLGIASYLEWNELDRGDATDRTADIIAYHYAAAAELLVDLGTIEHVPDDTVARAVEWLQKAAIRAQVAQAMPVAARLFGQALSLADPTDVERRMELLLGRAAADTELRRMPEASRDVQEARVLAASLGPVAEARCLLVLGDIEQKLGDLDAALATLDIAQRQFREADDLKGVSDAQRLIGLTLLFAGRLDDAEASISRALATTRRLEDRRGEAWALQNLAWISYVRGRPAEAEERITESANTFAELADSGGLNWALGLLGFVKFHQGHLPEAGELAEQVLTEARERGDRWGEGMMLLLMAGVRQWSGRATAALVAAEDALATFRAIGDRFGECQALAAVGRCSVSVGQIAEGLRALEGAVNDARTSTQDEFVRTAAAGLAGAAVQIGAPELALEALDALDESPHSFDSASIGGRDTLVARGLASLMVGQVEVAVAALEIATAPDLDGSPSPYALSALALASAARGDRQRVAELSAQVAAALRTTYSDRATAGIASLLCRSAGRDAGAAEGWDELLAMVDGTDDRVARAIVALARARGLAALGSPRAAAAADESDARLEVLDLRPGGWQAIFDLVLGTVPAEV
jgi:class 3 adenylate cyclase/tetratricopeptide (TPR) repeat protein